MESYLEKRETAYGGRGVFGKHSIGKDTLVHECERPYAFVIHRVFRKEVCAECFAYAFDANRNTWNIRSEETGTWFCSDRCRDNWLAEENVDDLWTKVNGAFAKGSSRMKKQQKDGRTPAKDGVTLRNADQITADQLDAHWKKAQNVFKQRRDPKNEIVILEDEDLDIARFVASAIIKLRLETQKRLPVASTFSWSALLDLQDNELPNIHSTPYILDVHIRVYTFLRQILPPELQPFVADAKVVRAVLARDHGNSFGIWQLPLTTDSEMLGWALYNSASYFNHSCSPNMRSRERVGRVLQFFATRDVAAGEELCISYIDVTYRVNDRRGRLRNGWYFDCGCDRCSKELGAGDVPPDEAIA